MRTQPIAVAMTAAWLAVASIGPAPAQEYPSKAVRTVIGFPPGGPNDLAMRPMAQKLQELLGQPFVVDYRPGANSIIGAELVAKSPPDGYTLLFISTAFTINPSSYAKLPYDTVRDFVGISPICKSDIVFVVNPVVPAQSVKAFVALAKSKPGKINYASSGTGGALHLGAEMLKMIAGIDMVHVPYKGAAQALTDVIAGHVDSMFIAAPPAIAQIKAGKVRALAVASAQRAPALPEVPTFQEAGWPNFRVDSRYGLVAPAATPIANINKLNAAIAKAAVSAELKERYAAVGLEPVYSPQPEFAAYIRDDIAKWRKVVAAAGLTPQ